MLDYRGLREEAFNANMKLNELELVLFTFGNASAVDRHNGVFAIKPSGVLYKDLSPEKMVIVDYNGETVSGDLRPSSDTNTHAVLYKHWNSIGGIVHTHSTYATAWAQSQKDIPIMGTTHADYLEIDGSNIETNIGVDMSRPVDVSNGSGGDMYMAVKSVGLVPKNMLQDDTDL